MLMSAIWILTAAVSMQYVMIHMEAIVANACLVSTVMAFYVMVRTYDMLCMLKLYEGALYSSQRMCCMLVTKCVTFVAY